MSVADDDLELACDMARGLAEAHLAAFASWLDEPGDALAVDDQAERRRIVAAFDAIPRTDYRTAWRKAGCRLGTALHSAACREYAARESDSHFRAALARGMVTGVHDRQGRLKHGLAALLRVVEADWAATHRPMAKAKVARAA